jgi:hypothetical protein
MEPYFINARQTHDWLFSALGLNAYPIVRRPLANPHSGLFLGRINALLGGEPDIVERCFPSG